MEQHLSDAHEGNWYVLVFGLPALDEPLILASGLSIRPLPVTLTVFDLAALGAVGFRAWAILEPLIAGCTAEIESARDANVMPGLDTLNRAWLAISLLILRGHTMTMGVAASNYSWREIPVREENTEGIPSPRDAFPRKARTDLPPFKGHLLDYLLRLFGDADLRESPVDQSDAKWMAEHFETFNVLANKNKKFWFALQAAVDWRYAKDSRSALARIWTGIESLFGISSELVYRISLLCASLLEPRGEGRKARFNAVKRLYGLRSKAVHGDVLSDEQLNTATSGSFHLLRQLLLITIHKGHCLTAEDFDEAVFG